MPYYQIFNDGTTHQQPGKHSVRQRINSRRIGRNLIRIRFVSTEAQVVSRQVHHSVRNQLAVPRKLTTPLCAKVMNFSNISFSFFTFLVIGTH